MITTTRRSGEFIFVLEIRGDKKELTKKGFMLVSPI